MIKKLAVALVTRGQIEAKTACSLIAALPHIGVPFQMFLGEGPYIHLNRDTVTNMAIEAGFSHILFVDSDMFFEADAIKRLINHDLDIVGGRYNRRKLPIESLVPDISKLSEVQFVPTGFLLINLEVFKKGGKPYFSHQDAESEDVYFCNKAIKNGYKIWCDPTIEIGHIGSIIY